MGLFGRILGSIRGSTGGAKPAGRCARLDAVKVRIAATNVAELLGLAAGRTPDKVALVEAAGEGPSDASHRCTWRELDDQVSALARGLNRLGLVGGQRVAIDLTNSVAFVAAYLAVLRAGMVAVPLNPSSTPGEVGRMLKDSGSRLCFADSATVAAVREGVAEAGVSTRLAVAGTATQEGETAYDDLGVGGPAVITPRDAESLAVLLYTSGTSGRPRGAMLSHRALLSNIDQASQTRPAPIEPDDLVLGVLPLFHVYGLNAVLGQVLLHGATLVLGPRFEPTDTLALIEAEQVTVVPVAPPVIGAWLKLDDDGAADQAGDGATAALGRGAAGRGDRSRTSSRRPASTSSRATA